MGIDLTPFWDNLYLYKFENRFMKSFGSSDMTSRKFHGCSRFIDDLVCLNDGNKFSDSFKEIYPRDLVLKGKHSGDLATFLELDIKINGEFFFLQTV